MDGVTKLRDVVRRARIEAGMTQQELAEAIGMSQRWVSNVEAGNVAQPRTATLHRLAAVLPVTVEDLLIAANLAKTRAGARRVAGSEPTPEDAPVRAELLDMLRHVRLDIANREPILRLMLRTWLEEDRAATPAASTSAPAHPRDRAMPAAGPGRRSRSDGRSPDRL